MWQKDGQVHAIAADGALIDDVRDGRYVDLPFVVGEGANERVREFIALLDALGELRPRVDAGVLVGQRRWNLKMKSGVDVKLPGDRSARRRSRPCCASSASRAFSNATCWRSTCAPRAAMFVRLTEEAAAAWADAACAEEGRAAMSFRPLPPRMRQIPARKSAILSVLDVGASKIVCLIARLTPMEPSSALRGRTHRCKVLGIGHQRSRGVKGGAIVDLKAAEHAMRLAVDAAERMAGVEVGSVIVNMSGGLLGLAALQRQGRRSAARRCREHDIHRVLEAASAASAQRRAHRAARPADRLLARRDARRARSQGHDRRGARRRTARRVLRFAAARNLMLVVERCHLRVEAMVATPYAAGLSTLVDDEAELGAARGRFRRRLDHGRRVLRRPARSRRRRRRRRQPRHDGHRARPQRVSSPTPSG